MIPLPPVTTSLTLLCVAVGSLTLGDTPLVAPTQLAAEGLGATVLTWWAAHASVGHLVANLGVLLWVAPPLERHVGSARMAATVLAGAAGGLGVHLLLHGGDRPVLGASSVVAALVAYTLVVGWHCPFEDRRGRAVLWPGVLFHLAVLFELVRTLGEVAAGQAASGAATHLGGLLAGTVACGLLHGRWPARPDARRPTTSRAVVPGLTPRRITTGLGDDDAERASPPAGA